MTPPTILKRTLTLFCLLPVFLSAYSQHYTANWLFGNFGLEFQQDTVIVRHDYPPHENRGCGIMSDENGNLQLYTDGFTVWNAMHEKMPNGDSLIIKHSQHSIHESLIIRGQGSESNFYIFTIDPYNGQQSSGLYYSIVDLNLEGGLGDVIVKGDKLLDTVSNKITAIFHNNHRDVWLITHKYNTNKYYAFLVTEAGISTNPVISQAGPSLASSFDGQLKASPDGRWLACSHEAVNEKQFVLFDFNDLTGVLSNPMEFPLPQTNRAADGIEFSSDATKLLVYQTGSTGESGLYQFDLSNPVYEDIFGSRIQLMHEQNNSFMQMQIAENGSIYITKGGGSGGGGYLAVVHNPNDPGANCIVTENGFYLEGASSVVARTPNFNQSYFFKPSFTLDNTCRFTPINFRITNENRLDSVRWHFGEGSTSSEFHPEFEYPDAGEYSVQLLAYYPEKTDTIIRQITIQNSPVFELGNDTTACPNLEIGVDDNFISYLWNNGALSPTITINKEGMYMLNVENVSGCVGSDSIQVSLYDLPVPLLPDTTNLDNQDSVQLYAGDFQSYEWSTGDTTQSIYVSKTGWYSVIVENENKCQISSTVYVTDGSQPGSQLESTDWELLNPKPSLAAGRDLCFVDENSGFFITENELIRTQDGGESWDSFMDLSSGRDMAFCNSIGYIVGAGGTIYKSTHMGAGWNKLPVDFDEDLNSISVIHPDTILITGDYNLFVSHDGGTSWVTYPVQGEDIQASLFTSSLVGHVACRDGIILKTIDGGLNWYITENTNIYPSDFFDIYFVNAQLGFASRENHGLFRTTDGGETWQAVAEYLESVYDFYFLNETTGYMAGANAAIYKTTDSGISWEPAGVIKMQDYHDLYGVYFLNEYNGFAVGDIGRIIKTTDASSNWKEYAPTYYNINQVAYGTRDTLYALAEKIYRSTDGGQTWDSLHTGVYNEDHYIYKYIDGQFLSADEFYVIASAGEISKVLKTSNGGNSFEILKSDDKSIRATSIHFLDQQTGYACNDYSSYWSGLHKTQDGGQSWEYVSGMRFQDFWFTDELTGFAIKGGDLYQTNDGGSTWECTVDISNFLTRINFANDTVGYISGTNGLVLKTTDKGKSWQEHYIDWDDNNGIYFYNQNIGFVAADYRKLHSTVNGGLTWETEILPAQINSISVSNDFEVYVGGLNGVIMKKRFKGDGISITLMEVEDQTDGEAVLKGIVSSNAAPVSEISFEYGQNYEFKYSTYSTPDIINPEYAETVKAEISDLQPDTEYNYRMKWTYMDKVYFSDTLLFRTLPEYELRIEYYAVVSSNTADLTGQVISNEDPVTNIVFEYSQDSSFSQSKPSEPNSIEGDTIVLIHCQLTQLKPNTRYLTRIRGSYKGEPIYSPVLEFHTYPECRIEFEPPYIQGNNTRLIAYITPYLDDMQNIIFEFGTSMDYGSSQVGSPEAVNQNWNMFVETNLTDLDTSQVYYYRIRAEMGGKTIYSQPDIINFPGGIMLVPLEAEQFSEDKILFQGLVNPGGKWLSGVYFDYGESGAFTDSVRAQPSYLDPYSTQTVHAEIDNLEMNTQYNFRIRAIESGSTHYSDTITFTFQEIATANKIPDVPNVIFFPNPANHILNLVTSEPMEHIRIFDIHGKILISKNFQSQIDISSLEPGLYFINIHNKRSVFTGRFMKE